MINWFCHMYPYGNLHELNLDWVIDTVKRGEQDIANFIGVNTIKYANPILWNIESQYEANTVVVDGQTGNAYISVKPVPSGVHLSRTEYWTQIYNYANVVDTLREQIAHNEGESTTATIPYSIGDLVFINGELYRVIAPMIAGDSFVIDSNVVKTTVEYELNRLHTSDTQLQANIDAEVTARSNADTQLQNNIDAEATARSNADTQLQNNIDAEATARSNADMDLSARLTNLYNQVNPLYKRVITVGSHGCDFTTIGEAIAQAKTYSSVEQRTAVLITSGTYNEEITLQNNGIDLIGMGQVIISYGSSYPNAPLFVYGTCHCENIYFLNTKSDGGAYAVHYEGQEDLTVVGPEVTFKNCIFASAGASALGFGCSDGISARFFDCLFYTTNTTSAPIYVHNLPQGAIFAQSVEFYNCTLNSMNVNNVSIHVDNSRAMQSGEVLSPMGLVFKDCVAKEGFDKVLFRYGENDTLPYVPESGEVSIASTSRNNTILGVNVNQRRYTLTRHIAIPSTPDYGTNEIRLDFITPFEATAYYRRINSVTINTGDYTNSFSVESVDYDCVTLLTTNLSVAGYYATVEMDFSLDPNFT